MYYYLKKLQSLGVLFLLILSLIILVSCEEKETIQSNVADAENSFYTTDGRLFITGHQYIYEYTKSSGLKKVFYTEKAEFLAMAQVGNYLYVIRSTMGFYPDVDFNLIDMFNDGLIPYLADTLSDMIMEKELLRINLNDSSYNFQAVHTIENMFLPNGMVADKDGNLYIADETFLSNGQIVKISTTGGIYNQSVWLDNSDGVYSPNGMAIKNNTIYFTDFKISQMKGYVKKVTIYNGNPGSVYELFSKTGILDDLSTGILKDKEGIAVADFTGNAILLLDMNGKLKDTLCKGQIMMPSSVVAGKGQGFDSNDLIVTEKGMLYNYSSRFGNKLTLIKLP